MISNSSVLILGSNGQLGSEFKDISSKYSNWNFIFKDFPEIDICNFDSLEKVFKKNKIDYVINCAAYTDVENCEIEKNKAYDVNSFGVENIIKIVEAYEIKMIHISTDYVFNGMNKLPYKENDKPAPLNVYGKSKLSGEKVILNSNSDSIIIRTSWLYSSYGKNFVKTVLKLIKRKDELRVFSDQIGNPTYANDLAESCLQILFSKKKISSKGRIYHFSSSGSTSWFDFAKQILKLSGLSCVIVPINSEYKFSSLVMRPLYSVLDNSKIKNDFGVSIPFWKNSLKKCILKIKNNKYVL